MRSHQPLLLNRYDPKTGLRLKIPSDPYHIDTPKRAIRTAREIIDYLWDVDDFTALMRTYLELWQSPHYSDAVISAVGLGDRFFFAMMILGLKDVVEHTYNPIWLWKRFREVESEPDGYLDLWAREHWKAVWHDELVPTPDGWKTHGDLQPGDMVFSPSGSPAMVIATTPTFYDADCYRVVFSDGEEIVVSGDHLWDVNFFNRQRVSGTKDQRKGWEVRRLNTRQIMKYTLHQQELRNPNYLSVDYAQPLILPERKLSISPYVLGIWLGDGDSSGGAVTNQFSQVWKEIVKEGYEIGGDICPSRPNSQRRTIYSLLPYLRELNLVGNKHIPPQYLRASLEQRTALLQGLMDSDGNVSTRGDLVFVTATKRLAEDVAELVRTLGMRANLRPYTHYKKSIGRECTFWQVAFRARPGIQPFRLQYHLDRFKPHQGKRWLGRKHIHHVEPVESVPCKCIQVASNDGRYLVGGRLTATHNSSIITFAGVLQEIAKDSSIYQALEYPDAKDRGKGKEITVGIFSHTVGIARSFVARIKRECENNPRLNHFYPDVFWKNPKKDAPMWSKDEGLIMKRKSNPAEPTVSGWGLVDGLPTGKHFKLMVFDDVVTERSVTTPEMILKTTEAWELAQFLASEVPKARIWHIGTRYKYGDTYETIIQRGAAIPRIHPATHDGTRDGVPVFLSPAVWEEKKKNTSPRVLACQMLQNPAAGDEQELKLDWLRWWDVRPETLKVLILVDPASSKKPGTSNSAFAVIGIDHARNKYLLDGACHKMNLAERWKMLKSLWVKWSRAKGVVSCEVGYERYGMQADIEHHEEMMKIEGISFPITPLSWPRDSAEGSKDDRIRRLIPDHQQWRFFYPWRPKTGSPEVDTQNMRKMEEQGKGYLCAKPIKRKDHEGKLYDLVDYLITYEYTFFPNTAHKDLLDCMSRLYDMPHDPPKVYRPEELVPEYAGDW